MGAKRTQYRIATAFSQCLYTRHCGFQVLQTEQEQRANPPDAEEINRTSDEVQVVPASQRGLFRDYLPRRIFTVKLKICTDTMDA